MKEEISKILESVLGDLKDIAKEYGAIIVVFAVAVYLWRKIK